MRKTLTLCLLLLSFMAFSAGHNATITVNQNVSCYGLTDGSATAAVSGGLGPFSFVWNNNFIGTTRTNMPAGNHYCIVTDSADMSVDTAFCTVTEPAQIIATASNTGPYCTGQTIQLNGTGGGTYQWTGTGPYTSTVQNPTRPFSTPSMSGIYSVTVTVGSCTATATTSVTVNATPNATASNTGPYCAGATIQLNGTGGGTYSWSGPGSFSGTGPNPTRSGSTPSMSGIYSVTVTVGSCTSTATTSVTVFANPTPTASNTGPYCIGQTIQLSGTGGGTYSWSGPNGFSAASQNPAIPNATSAKAGIYTLTVTVNGCTATSTTTVTINPNPSPNPSPQMNPVCAGAAVQLFPGITASTYAWTGPGGFTASVASPIINNVTWANAGTYTLSVTNLGCVGTATTSLMMSDPMIQVITTTDVSCSGLCNGSATPVIGNGFPPYTYSWSNGSTLSTNTNLCAGIYTVFVTDAVGCQTNASTIINQPAALVATVSQQTPPSSCNTCDGTLTMNGSGGTGTLNWTWTGPNGFASNNQNPGSAQLCAGIYSYTLSDQNGCTVNSSVALNSGNLSASVTSVNENCGQGNGSAVATVSGNIGNVSYSWQPGSMNTQSLYNLHAGTYTLTVHDSVSCSSSAIVTINNVNAPFLGTVANPTACGQANGSITASASGGTAPYQFSLNGGVYSGGNSWNNLLSGTYTVTVKDAANCMTTNNVNVLNTGLVVTQNILPANCSNNTGGVSLNPSNGTAPYTYLWNNGSTNSSLTNVAAGNYNCVVADAAGCSTLVYVYIWQNPSFYIYPFYDYYNCGNNSLTANIYNGTAPYTFVWSNGLTTQTVSNLSAGVYTVSVTDANGCSATGQGYIYNQSFNKLYTRTFADLNSNCVFDGADFNLYNWITVANNGFFNNYGFGNNLTLMHLSPGGGTYTVSAYPSGNGINPNLYQQNCVNPNPVILPAGCVSDTIEIPIDIVLTNNLRVTNYCGVARPGFSRSSSIYYANLGTTAQNAVVSINIDPLLTFTGATPSPSFVAGNHVEWNFNNFYPGQTGVIYVTTQVPTIANGGALGTPLQDSVWIDPVSNDTFPSDNVHACNQVIVGSYDPNEKEVYSPQADATGAIDTTGADLYYTVHFQNTGTDTAFTIVVRDTLSPNVDLGTLEMLGGSHALQWSMQPGRCLEVKFNQILLPDSNMNEPLSHGHFNYKIRTAQNISAGSSIDNTAGIYFDFNPPIITNTVSTPVQLTTSFVKQSDNQLEAMVFPNPSTENKVRVKLNGKSYEGIRFTLFDAQGKSVINKTIGNSMLFDVDLNGLPKGIYFYIISNLQGEKSTGKLVIQN